jgi:ATP-dependent Zn protease
VLILIVGIVATFSLLRPAFPSMNRPSTALLTFSSFVHNVQKDRIVSATIGPDGRVTGTLKGGRTYRSQIPLALQDNQLAGVLEQHRVTVTGVGPQSSLVGTLLSFLPLLFFVGIFLFIGPADGKRPESWESGPRGRSSTISKSR